MVVEGSLKAYYLVDDQEIKSFRIFETVGGGGVWGPETEFGKLVTNWGKQHFQSYFNKWHKVLIWR